MNYASKVVELDAKEAMTPEETLAVASRRSWSSVLVIGYDEDGDIEIDVSEMTVADAVTLCRLVEMKMLKGILG